MQAVAQGFGDIERVECPDPYNYGKFVEVAQIKGANERVTTTLEGRYALDMKSTLLMLARKGCAFDVQLHFGECTDPSVFNKFKKALILENAFLTNYSTEDLGALASGDEAVVNESVDISAEVVYEVLPVSYALKASSTVTNEVLDVIYCDSASCGECTVQSDGCKKVLAISKAAGGSPSTQADILISPDGGETWYAHDIEELTVAQDPSGIACLGDYAVVISNIAGSLCYVLKSELTGIIDPDFVEVTTGFVAGGGPNAISSTGNYAFIVGDGGYVYGTSDPTAGVDVLDAANATAFDLNDVHGLSSTFAVAVGDHGTVIYTNDGSTWQAAATKPTGVNIHMLAVWVKSETEWFVGGTNGTLYYTIDGGVIWTAIAFNGSGAGTIFDIVFATDSVGYMSHSTAVPKGRIFRTFDGGKTWVLTPEDTGSMPTVDNVNSIAVCGVDPNALVAVGLADDAADGFIVLGQSN